MYVVNMDCRISLFKSSPVTHRTRSSPDADKPTRRIYNQGHQTFHMLGIVSSCAIVTLSLRRAGFPIFDFKKCRDLENRVRGLSRSLEISPFDRARTTSCWHSIVTMALSCVISEIHVEKCHDLEIGVRGHSRSLKVVPFGRLCRFPISVI